MALMLILICGGGLLIVAVATAVYFYLRDKEA